MSGVRSPRQPRNLEKGRIQLGQSLATSARLVRLQIQLAMQTALRPKLEQASIVLSTIHLYQCQFSLAVTDAMLRACLTFRLNKESRRMLAANRSALLTGDSA